MRKVLQQLGEYKRDTFLCIGLTALEVIMEILMPFVTAIIIDRGLEAGNLPVVYRYGKRSTPTFRPFHFPILINSACPGW